ncbi:MAG: DUF1998 domain-containing protein, partial [Rhodocyclaceae bacterium]
IDYTKLKILDEFERREQAQAHSAHGEVHVVRRVAGYKKIRFGSHENIGYGPVNLPDQEMHTAALWWQLDEATLDRHFPRRQEALDGFLGAAYALHHMAALLSMADLRDFGRAVGDGAGTWSAVTTADGRGSLKSLDGQDMADALATPRFRPTVFLYDNHPGGMGLAAPLFEIRRELVERTLTLVRDCACAEGCPACVGPVIGYAKQPARTARQSALAILGLLEDKEPG